MKFRTVTTIFSSLILLYSCGQPTEFFIGKWQILSVVEDNNSFDLNENWMHLKSNGTFESYDGDLKKLEHGQWNYQAEKKTLLIEGEGESGDSQWDLSIRNDTLIFQSVSDNLYLIAKKMK